MDSISSQGYNNLTTMQEEYNLERIHLSEIDGALLMELLDDAPSADESENERLDFVIRSFEAEIGSDSGLMVVGDGESTTGPNDMDSDDGSLGGMDFDFDDYDGSRPMYDVGDDSAYAWKEMEMTSAVGPAVRELYVMGEDEELGFGGEQRECYYSSGYNYGSEYTCMEQVYSPLWQ